MSLFTEAAADAAEILAEIGRSANFRGLFIQVMLAENQIGASLLDGGFVPDGSFSIKFLASNYSAHPPLVGERIAVSGKQFRIRTVSHRPPSAFIICNLESAEK